jgi:hypothetical protein
MDYGLNLRKEAALDLVSVGALIHAWIRGSFPSARQRSA